MALWARRSVRSRSVECSRWVPLRDAGELESAEALFRRQLAALLSAMESKFPIETLTAKNDLAAVLVRRGDTAAASVLCRELDTAAREQKIQNEPLWCSILRVNGRLLLAAKRFEPAEAKLVPLSPRRRNRLAPDTRRSAPSCGI
jgi:hypothetical protein